MLRGRVTDAETDEALIGAHLEVVSDARKAGTVTRSDGAFEVGNLPPGSYTLTASYVGYQKHVLSEVVLEAGADQSVAMALAPTGIDVNPIIVTASRHAQQAFEASSAVSVIEAEALQTRPAMALSEHLKALPGVDVKSVGLNQDRVDVRGFGGAFGARLLGLVDYRIANLPSSRQLILGSLPIQEADIERVEVIEGPGSALYGPNAASGIVHIITRSPFDAQGTRVTITGGERDLRMASFRHAGTISDRVAYRVAGQYHQGREWENVDPLEPDSIVKGVQTSEGRVDLGDPIPNARDYDLETLVGGVRLDFRLTEEATAIISTDAWRNSGLAMSGGGASQIIDWAIYVVHGRFTYKDLFVQAFINKSNSGDESFSLRNGNLILDKSSQSVM